MAENRIENESFEINFILTEIKKKGGDKKSFRDLVGIRAKKNAKFRYSLTII